MNNIIKSILALSIRGESMGPESSYNSRLRHLTRHESQVTGHQPTPRPPSQNRDPSPEHHHKSHGGIGIFPHDLSTAHSREQRLRLRMRMRAASQFSQSRGTLTFAAARRDARAQKPNIYSRPAAQQPTRHTPPVGGRGGARPGGGGVRGLSRVSELTDVRVNFI